MNDSLLLVDLPRSCAVTIEQARSIQTIKLLRATKSVAIIYYRELAETQKAVGGVLFRAKYGTLLNLSCFKHAKYYRNYILGLHVTVTRHKKRAKYLHFVGS